MTICIAAIGRDGANRESIVFCTDHMVTVSELGEFEHVMDKYTCIGNHVMMFSGNPLLIGELTKGLSASIEIEELANEINKRMSQIESERRNKEVLQKYGLNLEFIKGALKEPIKNPFMERVMEAYMDYTIASSAILVGYDKNGVAQLYEIDESRVENNRDINFDAIGSGAPQALNTLLFQKHSKKDGLHTTLYNVYKAKRNSEVARGVGKETELSILFKDPKPQRCRVQKIDVPGMERLSNVYNSELTFGKEHSEIKNIVNKL